MTDAKDPILVASTPEGVLRMAEGGDVPSFKNLPRRPLPKLETPISNKIWLLSFTDITALILTFFVLTYAMSDPEKEDLKNIMAAFNHELGAFQGEPLSMGNFDTISLPRLKDKKGLDLSYLAELAESRKAQSLYLADLVVERQEDSVIFSLPVSSLFEGDGLSTAGQPVFEAFSNILSGLPNRMELRMGAGNKEISGQLQILRRMRAVTKAWQKAGLSDLSGRTAVVIGFTEPAGPEVLSVRVLAEASRKGR